MSKKSFTLSASGLKNVNFVTKKYTTRSEIDLSSANIDDNDFLFIFGEKKVLMKQILAEFISPRVSRMRQSDPTINSISFDDDLFNENTNSTIFDTEVLQKFEDISKGNEIEIDEPMISKLRLLSIFLDNTELFNQMNQLYSINLDESHIDQYLSYLQCFDTFNNKFNSTFSFDKDPILNFVSSHFSSINKEKLLKLSKSTIYSIIENENFKYSSDDSLFDFFKEFLSDDDEERYSFYEKVNMKKLSVHKFREFFEEINPNDITITLWEKLKEYLFECFMITDKSTEIAYDGDPSHRFNGIIRHLGNGNPINVINNGIVDVTSSSIGNKLYMPQNIVDFDNDGNVFHSSNDESAWVMFDFKERKVKPNKYSIKSNPWGNKGHYHLQNWVIEGSNDNSVWTTLDKHSDEKSLDDKLVSNTFSIQNTPESNKYFRYLRLRQTGENTQHSTYLVFKALEFFGSILDP